ncbi:MAG: hypothetical protein HY231_03075 [Acidobacteria bacterium]|nr:hypothetical protein [Acidobacteriota bacterium]
MKDVAQKQYVKILRAIKILSATTFSLAGETFSASERTMTQLPIFPAPNPLVAQLAQQLYQHCYCRKFTGEVQPMQPSEQTADDNLLGELAASNMSREHWDAGWQTFRLLPSGQIVAHKNGRTRLLWPGEFVSHEGPGVPPREGANISLFAPKESQTMQPGFYFAFSESIPDQQDDYQIVRFYWHIKQAGAAKLVRFITQELNRFQIPFRFKTLTNRSFFQRSDAAVLYVGKRFYKITVALLADLHPLIKDYLGTDTPLFTKRLAYGLGLAEEPGNGESFGQHRCRIFAEGVWQAYEKGVLPEVKRLQEVRAQFAHHGLSLDHPYLNPGSQDYFDFPESRIDQL